MATENTSKREQLSECLDHIFKAQEVDVPIEVIQILLDYASDVESEWFFKNTSARKRKYKLEKQFSGSESSKISGDRNLQRNICIRDIYLSIKIDADTSCDYKVEFKVIELGKGIQFGLYAQREKTYKSKRGKLNTELTYRCQTRWIREPDAKKLKSYLYSSTNSEQITKCDLFGSSKSLVFGNGDVIGCEVTLYAKSERVDRTKRLPPRRKLNLPKQYNKHKGHQKREVSVYGITKYTKNGQIIRVEDPGLEGEHFAIPWNGPYVFRVELRDDATVCLL